MVVQYIEFDYNWVYKLCYILRENSLGWVWDRHLVECKTSFLSRLRESLISRYSDTWDEELQKVNGMLSTGALSQHFKWNHIYIVWTKRSLERHWSNFALE